MTSMKRKRSVNWDILEKNLLRTTIQEFVSIIENKNTDTNTNKSKIIAWQTVTQRFNELNCRHRELAEIKQQWRTMKLEAKKNMSDVKMSMKSTGGGPKPPSPNPETLEILNMIPQEFETDSNLLDSDGITINKEEANFPTVQDFVTPMNNKENLEEKITPVSSKLVKPENIFKKIKMKRKLPFKEYDTTTHQDLAKERNNVLLKCIQEENELKMKNLTEIHALQKEEHILKIKQMVEVQNFLKEESQLRIEKLKLEIMLLKSQINKTN